MGAGDVWQMVPRRLTEEMARAYLHEQDGSLALRYRAMLDAAPRPLDDATLFSRPVRDILRERQRQIEVEGWSLKHDDRHTDGSLAMAAACYAHPERIFQANIRDGTLWSIIWAWPRSWAPYWFKKKDRRRDLVRAAALIVAEIERLDRISETERKSE